MSEVKDMIFLHVSGLCEFVGSLAVNEPLVSAVTEWKVSDAKTATMLK